MKSKYQNPNIPDKNRDPDFIGTKLQKSKIISNKKIKDNYFEIIVEAPEIARYAQPGQFVNIKVNHGFEPLLRRPFSIHRTGHQGFTRGSPGHQSEAKGNVVILYEVVGRGSEILSQKKAGEYLGMIGPLGNGFRIPYPVSRNPILIAGGMGTAPLVFLAEKIVTTSPRHHVTNKPLVLLGAKTKDDILCEKEFKKLGCEVKIATDDDSRGFPGNVTELLRKELSRIPYPVSRIYGCGPAPMLKEISLISRKYHIPAQISLEAHMACGIGACMGCVIKVKSEKRKMPDASRISLAGDFEYRRVCYEGPVFNAQEILW